MRTLYLIRHGQTQHERRCISKTDVPLDETGIYQAERLREWAQTVTLTGVFSSPLKRCIQTACILSGGRIPTTVCGELREMDVGAWENLTFDEICAQYPEEYAARGTHPGTVPPPGGESLEQAGVRMLDSLKPIIAGTCGDIAVVAHGGINRGALCKLMRKRPDDALSICQPWGGISALAIDGTGTLTVMYAGQKPDR